MVNESRPENAESTPCVVCATRHRRGAAQHGLTCSRCRVELRRDLDKIAARTIAAAGYVTKRSTGADTGSSTNPPESKPPLDLDALDDSIGHDTLAILEGWERIIRRDLGLTPYGVVTELDGASIVRTISFLRAYLEKLADEWPPVDELAREIRALARNLSRYDDETKSRQEAIECPALDDDDDPDSVCGARIIVSRIDANTHVTCPRCSYAWTTARLVLAARTSDVDVWLDEDAAAIAAGVSKRHLRRLAKTHALVRDQARYSLADIQRLGDVRNVTLRSRRTRETTPPQGVEVLANNGYPLPERLG